VSFPKAGEETNTGGLTPGGGAGLMALPTDIVPLTGRVVFEGAGAAARRAVLKGGAAPAMGRLGSGAGAGANAMLLFKSGGWLVTLGGQMLGMTADRGPSP
jgi:hypothetical protein